MNENENLLLQRLVDGELDRQQVRRILHQAESEPALYRRIALAMIEDQIWRREILRREAAGCESAPASAPLDGGEALPARFARQPENWMRRSAPLLAMAAAMLMMTWLGYRTGESRGVNARPAPSASLASQPAVLPATGDPDAAGQLAARTLLDQAPYRMQMVSNESGQPEGPSLPVMSINAAHEIGLQYQPTRIPDELQLECGRRGFRLQPQFQCLSGRTSDGRQILVPLEGVRVSPWGQ